VAGGLAYTAGVPFYMWKGRRYTHAIWHLFVLGASRATSCRAEREWRRVRPESGSPAGPAAMACGTIRG